MRRSYRVRPEVVDRARDRLGCTSDAELAVKIGISPATVARVRRGEGSTFATALPLLDAAAVGVEAGVVARDSPAA